jgi:hypothetical protein
MGCCSGKVRITETSENTELVKREWKATKNLVWGVILKCFCMLKIEEKRGSMKGFNPINWRHTSLEKK